MSEKHEQKISVLKHQIIRAISQISKLDEILQANERFREQDPDPQNTILYNAEHRLYARLRAEYMEFLQGCEEHLTKLLNH